jgi:acetoin:2,6-dichlorophenolindophenol oxidoreductase subunit beta
MDVPDELGLYERMCYLRHFEERVDVLYRQGHIHGPAHLAGQGIAAEVMDLRTLVPLDAAAVLASVRRTGRLVVAEENPGQLGWGAAIAAIAAEEAFGDLAAPVARVSGGNVPLPVAASLEAEVGVSAARVVAAARAVLNHR